MGNIAFEQAIRNGPIPNQPDRMKSKLAQLRQADPGCKLFGARTHRYQLNPVLTPTEAQAFEQTHQVALPADYVAFLTEVGDGGAGPYYGVRSVAESRRMAWQKKALLP